MLFRTLAKMKFVTSKICVAIYSSFTNTTLTTISVFKLIYLLDILRNLATFTTASSTFRFLDVFVCNFSPYQITFKGVIFMRIKGGFSPNKTSLCPSFSIFCASFKTLWKFFSSRRDVGLRTRFTFIIKSCFPRKISYLLLFSVYNFFHIPVFLIGYNSYHKRYCSNKFGWRRKVWLCKIYWTQWYGWHDKSWRYWWVSVSFMYKLIIFRYFLKELAHLKSVLFFKNNLK